MASIIKRNNSYNVQVSLYKYGKNKRLTKTFDNKADAQRWALEMELEKGNGKELARRDTSFTEYYQNWIHIVKKKDVREATFLNYVNTGKVIRNLFGDIKLRDLNDIVIQKKIDYYAETHSRKTVHEVVLKIRSSLRDAWARGYLTNDFASLIKTRGKEAEKRNKTLSITNLKKLRSWLIEHAEEKELYILALLALESGARRGELLGLRPEDLYEHGIYIRRSLSPTNDDTKLKTKKSHRAVSINKTVYDLVLTVPVKEDGYIFGKNGFKQSEQLAELLKELGIPKTTFHGLRDSHASLLFSQDIDLTYVSKRLGHSSIQTTQNYYIELMPEKKHQHEADALNVLNTL